MLRIVHTWAARMRSGVITSKLYGTRISLDFSARSRFANRFLSIGATKSMRSVGEGHLEWRRGQRVPYVPAPYNAQLRAYSVYSVDYIVYIVYNPNMTY